MTITLPSFFSNHIARCPLILVVGAMSFCSMESTRRRLWKNMEASSTTGLLWGHSGSDQTRMLLLFVTKGGLWDLELSDCKNSVKLGAAAADGRKRGEEENSWPTGRTARTSFPSADLGPRWRGATGKGRYGGPAFHRQI